MNLYKINRDPFYSDLYNKYGLEFIENAGYFEDSISDDKVYTDHLKLTIPVDPIVKNIKKAKNPVIIIATGSFCPIHSGHIEMMTLAKSALEKKGFDVLAGYISPDHDEYIVMKNGDDAILIHERIQLINKISKKYDWLMADPSSGVFSKGSINLSEAVNRLDLYLKETFKKDIKVFYVCGGDNARFANTFIEKGNCVVIGRPKYEKEYLKVKKELKNNKNIVFTKGKNPLSSTIYRSMFKHDKLVKQNLSIRIEENDDREKILFSILIERFKSIQFTKVSDQKDIFNKLNKNNDLISLDSIFHNEKCLKISRHYDLFGCNMIGYGKRPNSLDLLIQASKIKKGKYILIDDDIHTGGTMRFAKNIMESCDHSIEGVMSLMMSVKREEILDSRDFFIGGENNGLVVKLPNKKLTRVPYIYPYVCPYNRASVLDPLDFSLEVWKMNHTYFKGSNSKLKDHKGMIEVFKYIGFNKKSLMEDICLYHIKELNKLK